MSVTFSSNLSFHSFSNSLKLILKLIKIKIAFAITFTTFTGYILFSKNFDLNILFSVIGVFLMSSGALALNQYQEILFDSLMNRTKDRPLPLLEVNKTLALIISFLLIFVGFFILYQTSLICALLGLFNVLWYNILYTYLKRLTVFAVVPGSLVGVVPAFIGWCGAGGSFFDFKILCLGIFLFIWQIPHFWLILYFYNNDYAAAGFPSIANTFSLNKIKNIVFVWVVATCFSTLMFPFFNIISINFLIAILLLINFTLIFIFYKDLKNKKLQTKSKIAMISINLYMLLVMLIVVFNSILV